MAVPGASVRIDREMMLNPAELVRADFSFLIREIAQPPFEGPALGEIVAVTPYRKSYPAPDAAIRFDGVERLLIVARDEHGLLAGYLIASRAWNGCAQIDDLAIDAACRRHGIGRTLVEEAIGWARAAALPMIRLETQSNNVAACRFYAGLGFQLAGSDRLLYAALGEPASSETALFWYRRI